MAKKSRSRSKKSTKRRGLVTAAEGFAKKGYSVGQQLGDVEIELELWTGKIGIVLCSIIFIAVFLSLIYQIINAIYQTITGKGLCDIFNICSTPHNLIDKSKITSTSGSGANEVSELINYDKPNKSFVLIGFTLLCLLIFLKPSAIKYAVNFVKVAHPSSNDKPLTNDVSKSFTSNDVS